MLLPKLTSSMEELDSDKATTIIVDLLVEQIIQDAPSRILGQQDKHPSIQMRGIFVNTGQIEEQINWKIKIFNEERSKTIKSNSKQTNYMVKR